MLKKKWTEGFDLFLNTECGLGILNLTPSKEQLQISKSKLWSKSSALEQVFFATTFPGAAAPSASKAPSPDTTTSSIPYRPHASKTLDMTHPNSKYVSCSATDSFVAESTVRGFFFHILHATAPRTHSNHTRHIPSFTLDAKRD